MVRCLRFFFFFLPPPPSTLLHSPLFSSSPAMMMIMMMMMMMIMMLRRRGKRMRITKFMMPCMYTKTSLQQIQDVGDGNPINALVSCESYSTTPWPSPAIRATISIELPLDGEDRAEGRVLGEMASGDALPHRLSPTPHQPSPDTARRPIFIPSKSRESNCEKTFCFRTFQLYPKCFRVPSMHLQITELQLSPKSPNA